MGVVVAATGFSLGSAVVLGLVLVGLVSLAHSLVLGTNADRIKSGICLGVSIVAVLLVGASDFGHTQIVLDKPLDTMNIWSQLVVALLAAGIASGLWQAGPKAISNIGIPMPKFPSAKKNYVGAPVAGTGLQGLQNAPGVVVTQPAGPNVGAAAVPAEVQALLDAPAQSGYPGNVPPTDEQVAALAPKG